MVDPIPIPEDYNLVLLVILLMAFQCLFVNTLYLRDKRKIFNKEYMEKNFNNIHQQETGKKISKGGYPDMGNGFYSTKLPYGDWFQFNNSQRAHYNYLESLTPTIVFLLICGLHCAKLSALCGLLFIFGRVLYIKGYNHPKGANSVVRRLGAVTCDLGFLIPFGYSVHFLYPMIKAHFK